jgi:hypothetical protein
MSNWMQDAQRRIEQKKCQEEQQLQQQQILAEQQRQAALQQQMVQQQRLYNELNNIVTAVGVKNRLEYIQQNVWRRCGQIEPYQGQYKISKTLYEATYFTEAGFRLHFAYETVRFVKHGGYVGGHNNRAGNWQRGSWSGPESKELVHRTLSVILQITAQENTTNGPNGNRHLGITEVHCIPEEFEKRRSAYGALHWSFPIVPRDLTALSQQLDECLYLYSQETKFHHILAEVAQGNRQEEERYRNYQPRSRP